MIVLDTHAWIWLASDPSRLGRSARAALRRERSLGIAAISCWELATLEARRRIALDRDPVDRLIVATALTHGATLVTRDERIRRAGGVVTVW